MADEREKRRLLGIADDKPLPTFGKRNPKPAAEPEPETSDRELEAFRDEARSLLQKGRERSEEEMAEAKIAGKKASLINLIRKKRKPGEPEEPDELAEEEEWRRRMSAAPDPKDVYD